MTLETLSWDTPPWMTRLTSSVSCPIIKAEGDLRFAKGGARVPFGSRPLHSPNLGLKLGIAFSLYTAIPYLQTVCVLAFV